MGTPVSFRNSAVHDGFTLKTDTVQIKLTQNEGKELISQVLSYMQVEDNAMNPKDAAWLYERSTTNE